MIPYEKNVWECHTYLSRGIMKHATTVKIAMAEANKVPSMSTWIPSQREITINDFAFRVYNDSTHLISNSKPISSSRRASQYHQSDCPKKCYTYLFSISTSFSLSTQCSVSPYARMVARPEKDSEKWEYSNERGMVSEMGLIHFWNTNPVISKHT